MNSKELYFSLYQVVNCGVYKGWPSDFYRPASVHIGYSSNVDPRTGEGRNGKNTNTISHVTVEFCGVTSKYLCCIRFDGSGSKGTSISRFAMPGIKLSLRQKAAALLAVLEFLSHAHLVLDMEFYRSSIAEELNNQIQSPADILQLFDLIHTTSKDAVERAISNKGVFPMPVAL